LLLGAAFLLQNARFAQFANNHIYLLQTAITSPKKIPDKGYVLLYRMLGILGFLTS